MSATIDVEMYKPETPTIDDKTEPAVQQEVRDLAAESPIQRFERMVDSWRFRKFWVLYFLILMGTILFVVSMMVYMHSMWKFATTLEVTSTQYRNTKFGKFWSMASLVLNINIIFESLAMLFLFLYIRMAIKYTVAHSVFLKEASADLFLVIKAFSIFFAGFCMWYLQAVLTALRSSIMHRADNIFGKNGAFFESH